MSWQRELYNNRIPREPCKRLKGSLSTSEVSYKVDMIVIKVRMIFFLLKRLRYWSEFLIEYLNSCIDSRSHSPFALLQIPLGLNPSLYLSGSMLKFSTNANQPLFAQELSVEESKCHCHASTLIQGWPYSQTHSQLLHLDMYFVLCEADI